jgi:hypothetical protein
MNNLNITAKRGDTFTEVPFQINVNSVPLDLTGAVIRMQLRTDYGGDIYLDLTSVDSNGITITNAANGEFKINQMIIELESFAYKYDIQITLANGEVKTWIEGIFNVSNDVTR